MIRLLKAIALTSLLLLSAPALAGPVSHAFTGNTASSASVGSNPSVTIPIGGIPAGSAVYVAVYEASIGSFVTANGLVADNASTPNTYTELSGGVEDGSGARLQIFQAYNSNALASGNTITYTLTSVTNRAVMSVFYATGLTTTNPFDGKHTTIFTSSPIAGNLSLPPSVAGELFIAVAGWENFSTSAGYTLDTGNGWAVPPTAIESTFSTSVTNYYGVGGGTQVNSGTGTLTTQPTFTATTNGSTIILGLKPATTTPSPFFFKPFP